MAVTLLDVEVPKRCRDCAVTWVCSEKVVRGGWRCRRVLRWVTQPKYGPVNELSLERGVDDADDSRWTTR